MVRMKLALICLTLSMLSHNVAAIESPAGSPVEHMSFLSDLDENLSMTYMSYISEVAHGNRARKMEKRRLDLVGSIRTAIGQGKKLKPYEGDATLRDAYVGYWNVLLSIINEDYHKIVDMEEIAEQSYDAMEAYLLLQEKASDKLSEASDRVYQVYRAFAAQYNVTLTEGHTSKLSRKLASASKVHGYMNKMFLINFKSSVQENNMIAALNKKDINAFEQSRNAMKGYAEEGMARLDTVNKFKDDASVINACRKVFEFQLAESGRITALSDFLLKKDEFEKTRKSFEAKPANNRTKADVDAYNQEVDRYIKVQTEYNKVNNELNKGRSQVLKNWDDSRKRFMDTYVPHM